MVTQYKTPHDNDTTPEIISVLVVEDHPVAADGLVSYLETAEDIQVVGVIKRGEEVLAAIEALSPNVITLDLVLDGSLLNGIDVAHLVRKHYPDVKLLALSAYPDQWRIHGAVDAGVSGYLLKTSSYMEIIEAIRQVSKGLMVFDPKVMEIIQLYLRGEVNISNRASQYGLDLEIELPTKREWQVLKLIAEQKSNVEIAAELTIASTTVKTHVHNIFKKLRLTDRTQARVWFLMNRHLCRPCDKN